MKISRIVIFFLLYFSFGDTYGQTNSRLAERIDSLYVIDQSVQHDIQKALENKVAFDSIQKLQAIEKQVFDRHIPVAKDIFAINGYPTVKKAGTEASNHFFLLIQHADSDTAFQSSMLPILKKLSKKGEVSKKGLRFSVRQSAKEHGEKAVVWNPTFV